MANQTLRSRIRNLQDSLREARTRARRYNVTYAELDAMTNAELADIGLSRRQIPDIARNAAHAG